MVYLNRPTHLLRGLHVTIRGFSNACQFILNGQRMASVQTIAAGPRGLIFLGLRQIFSFDCLHKHSPNFCAQQIDNQDQPDHHQQDRAGFGHLE